ncbi:MAG: hypothetical protein BROFUL_00132 [Candidatus Brocadia fulgida]|uniref:Uncharacterized protein n=1 Tax=Candidatus Brocadia fulgida TaxID=380242 RepID=A0A0M2V1X6_9BACT|nr:MAG: hypothetical protein BROFUL_00132 [Candidatus Brocadia fulgida]
MYTPEEQKYINKLISILRGNNDDKKIAVKTTLDALKRDIWTIRCGELKRHDKKVAMEVRPGHTSIVYRSIISTFARGTMTVEPSENPISSIRTVASVSMVCGEKGSALILPIFPK